MNLFESHRKKFLKNLTPLIPLLMLTLVGVLFFTGINATSAETLKKEQQALEQALENGAVRTYALTGRYPESLDQILNDYHITYDQNRFVVEYTPNGANLLPAISVISLSDSFSSGKEARS